MPCLALSGPPTGAAEWHAGGDHPVQSADAAPVRYVQSQTVRVDERECTSGPQNAGEENVDLIWPAQSAFWPAQSAFPSFCCP